MIERITRSRSAPAAGDKPIRRNPRAQDLHGRNEAPPETTARPALKRIDVHAEAKLRLRREIREKIATATVAPVESRPERLDPRARRGNRARPDVSPDVPDISTHRLAPAGGPILDNVLRIESPSSYVCVVTIGSEAWSASERELLGGARQIADGLSGAAVALFRIGVVQPDCDAGAGGADRLWQIGQNETSPEIATAHILTAIQNLRPSHIIFPEGSVSGDIARRVAADLGERPAVFLQKVSDRTIVTRGNGGRSDFTRPLPRILLATSGLFDPIENAPPREARMVTFDTPLPPAAGITDLGLEEMSVANVPLTEADFIVSAGDGITDWAGFFDVADALSGVIGGSRQVCDAGLLPRHRQVGASGTLVEAKAYLALGISGAPQHLQGIQRCRFVAAVNTDLHAAMVKRADLAIIADAQAVMPELASLAREKRHAR